MPFFYRRRIKCVVCGAVFCGPPGSRAITCPGPCREERARQAKARAALKAKARKAVKRFLGAMDEMREKGGGHG